MVRGDMIDEKNWKFEVSPLWANSRAAIEEAEKRMEAKRMQMIRMVFMLGVSQLELILHVLPISLIYFYL
jgi:hypothetical protein